jgi:regulatory protein
MTEYYQYILSKAKQYCSYQERCLSEVKTKFEEWQVQPKIAVKILAQLIQNDYLNEERFAKNYATGKFRQKQWGKNKIIHALKQKQIPDLIIQIGVEEIDDSEYIDALTKLLKKKSKEIKETNHHKKNYKMATYAINKGFRSALVWDVIDQSL